MTITHSFAARPLRSRLVLLGSLLTAFVLVFSLAQPLEARAAGVPGVPQYTYRMVSVSKTGTRVKSEALSTITCQRIAGGTTTAVYSVSSTRSNNFSVTGGLGFDALSGLLKANVSVTGGVTTSSTYEESLSISVPYPKCAQVFALRDKYSYTLQKRCNIACTGVYANKTWVSLGGGSYTKFVGRAYYYV